MKEYNDKKICFIICANNDQYLRECLFWLELLVIPEGYETEVLTIENAISMTAGYNEGMNASDAKYKIYLHQDTFVRNSNMLMEMLDIFQRDSQIGMIGTVGAEKLSNNGVMWHGVRCGNFYCLDRVHEKLGRTLIEKIDTEYREVEVVDGLFMATQYDIPWREDLFDGWDFYDVSQCLEFKRAGYKVVIPKQEILWVIHDSGIPNFSHYDKYRKLALNEYKEFFDRNKIRILFVHSSEILLAGLGSALMELGHDMVEYPERINLSMCTKEEKESLEDYIEEGFFDLVMTYNFICDVSDICSKKGVRYYAWVFDSPLLTMYTESVKNHNNFISVFDKKQYERLQNQEIRHLKHFPLATEVNLFSGAVITKEDEKVYSTDVSFVGRLYEKRGFEELFEGAPQEYINEAEKIVKGCNCVWDGKISLFEKASDGLIDYLIDKTSSEFWKARNIDKRYYFESMKFARKCNEYERVTILNEIAKKYNVVLYTKDVNQESLKGVEIRPWVDYLWKMPKVFHLSKINLNITSRSIETGIPQRVWDIMAVGGFCLTNYQAELEDYFEIGRDIEVFHNLGELMEKIEYYLNHEEARVRIAINGYKKVRKYHTYSKRLIDVLEWIDAESD